MHNKILELALAVGVAALPMTAATISVVPSSATATVGDTITADINISDVLDLYAFQFDVSFAPGVLSANTPTDGLFLNSGGFFSGFTDNAAGTITFIADSLVGLMPGISGAGTLARIQFTAVGPGTSPITIGNPVLLDSNLFDIAAITNGSTVTVSAIPEPGTVSFVLLGLAALVAVSSRCQITKS